MMLEKPLFSNAGRKDFLLQAAVNIMNGTAKEGQKVCNGSLMLDSEGQEILPRLASESHMKKMTLQALEVPGPK